MMKYNKLVTYTLVPEKLAKEPNMVFYFLYILDMYSEKKQ